MPSSAYGWKKTPEVTARIEALDRPRKNRGPGQRFEVDTPHDRQARRRTPPARDPRLPADRRATAQGDGLLVAGQPRMRSETRAATASPDRPSPICPIRHAPRSGAMSVLGRETRVATRHPPHNRHAPAPSRRPRGDHRAVCLRRERLAPESPSTPQRTEKPTTDVLTATSASPSSSHSPPHFSSVIPPRNVGPVCSQQRPQDRMMRIVLQCRPD